MGNKGRSREVLRQMEEKASWDHVRLNAWRPDEDERPMGSGLMQIQIAHWPAFEESSFWEVCRCPSEWRLYTAQVKEGRHGLIVKGYEQIAILSEQLQSYYRRLQALVLPILPPAESVGGADGETTRLTLAGSYMFRSQLTWWCDMPPEWRPLIKISEEMRAAFKEAKTRSSASP